MKRALTACVRALARRPRTVAELETYLGDREYPTAVVQRVLTKLRELRYLDDAAVADVIVRDADRRNLGSRRVAQTLARRGVSPDLAAAAEHACREGDLTRARRLLARRHPGGWEGDPRGRERALRLLVRRGFPFAVARRAVGLDLDG